MIKFPTLRQLKGATAEDLAQDYLKKQGLTLIARNFRCKPGEIDLIFEQDETIIFVEVRHRVSAAFGTALDSITPVKQSKIIKAATLFMLQKKWYNLRAMRFDVITLQGKLAETPNFNWIKQAFSGATNETH